MSQALTVTQDVQPKVVQPKVMHRPTVVARRGDVRAAGAAIRRPIVTATTPPSAGAVGRIALEVGRRTRGAGGGAGGGGGVLRLTRRGRLLVFLVAIVAVFAAFSLGRASSNATPRGGAPTQRLVVAQGDTLWSIAKRIAPGSDPRNVVAQIASVNHLHGPLQAGQTLLVPAR